MISRSRRVCFSFGGDGMSSRSFSRATHVACCYKRSTSSAKFREGARFYRVYVYWSAKGLSDCWAKGAHEPQGSGTTIRGVGIPWAKPEREPQRGDITIAGGAGAA